MPGRKPSVIMELNGTYKHNPSRRRKTVEPSEVPIGEPPAHLGEDQAAIWREIRDIAPPMVLKHCDGVALEMMTVLVLKLRTAPFTMTAADAGQLRNYLGEFGMTPASREKFSVDQTPKKADTFSEFRAA